MPRSGRSGRLKLPTQVEEGLRLEAGERPLAWATDTFERWYVGTDRALHLPDGDGHRRLVWEHVDRAEWQQESEVLTVVELGEWETEETPIPIAVAEPGRLLELVQERVTKSVVSTTYTPLEGRHGLTLVARRSPTGRGPITWSYVLTGGLDPEDPEVIGLIADAKATAERELGDLA